MEGGRKRSILMPDPIHSNDGGPLHPQQKFRRVRKMSDDEDDEEEEYGKEEHEKEAIAEEIFQDGEGEEGQEAVEAPMAAPEEEEEEDEESGRWPESGNLVPLKGWFQVNLVFLVNSGEGDDRLLGFWLGIVHDEAMHHSTCACHKTPHC